MAAYKSGGSCNENFHLLPKCGMRARSLPAFLKNLAVTPTFPVSMQYFFLRPSSSANICESRPQSFCPQPCRVRRTPVRQYRHMKLPPSEGNLWDKDAP